MKLFFLRIFWVFFLLALPLSATTADLEGIKLYCSSDSTLVSKNGATLRDLFFYPNSDNGFKFLGSNHSITLVKEKEETLSFYLLEIPTVITSNDAGWIDLEKNDEVGDVILLLGKLQILKKLEEKNLYWLISAFQFNLINLNGECMAHLKPVFGGRIKHITMWQAIHPKTGELLLQIERRFIPIDNQLIWDVSYVNSSYFDQYLQSEDLLTYAIMLATNPMILDNLILKTKPKSHNRLVRRPVQNPDDWKYEFNENEFEYSYIYFTNVELILNKKYYPQLESLYEQFKDDLLTNEDAVFAKEYMDNMVAKIGSLMNTEGVFLWENILSNEELTLRQKIALLTLASFNNQGAPVIQKDLFDPNMS